jgi:hypothetical protein
VSLACVTVLYSADTALNMISYTLQQQCVLEHTSACNTTSLCQLTPKSEDPCAVTQTTTLLLAGRMALKTRLR